MFAGDFIEILTTYNMQKTKSFNNNPLVLKIRNEIPEKISELLDKSLTVKAACGVSSWPKSPWITIIHKRFSSSQEALIIQYNFDIDNKTATLAVISRRMQDDDSNLILRSYLNNLSLNDFKPFKNNSFLSKTYEFDQINDYNLTKDLKNISEIYKEMCDIIFNQDKAQINEIPNRNQIKDKYQNSISPDEFFKRENIEKIMRCDITVSDYKNILDTVRNENSLKKIIEENDINLDDLAIKDRILLYSKSYVDTEYKSVGNLLGSYSFNKILIDDRLPSPLIITSVIHELSHFLLEKILKEVLMKILNTNDNPLISGFIKITLEDSDLNYLADEYCAHCVEGRFTLYGFQDYSSFTYKLSEISDLYSREDVEYALVIGNTFAYDIKDILEEFIDEKQREEIKREFLTLRDLPDYMPLDLEIESRLEDEDFIEAIAIILSSGIAEVINQGEKLERYMNKYEDILYADQYKE